MTLALTSGHLTRTLSGHLAICPVGFPQCCLYPDPASITISGATGCAAFANGTYALPPDGFPNPPCEHWLTVPVDPPADVTVDYCATDVSFGATRYWHPKELNVIVYRNDNEYFTPIGGVLVGTQGVRVFLEIVVNLWVASGPSIVSTRTYGSFWYRQTCQTGTFVTDYIADAANGTSPTSISVDW